MASQVGLSAVDDAPGAAVSPPAARPGVPLFPRWLRRLLVALNGGPILDPSIPRSLDPSPKTPRPTDGSCLRHGRRGGDTDVAITPAGCPARMPAAPSEGHTFDNSTGVTPPALHTPEFSVTPPVVLTGNGDFVHTWPGGTQ